MKSVKANVYVNNTSWEKKDEGRSKRRRRRKSLFCLLWKHKRNIKILNFQKTKHRKIKKKKNGGWLQEFKTNEGKKKNRTTQNSGFYVWTVTKEEVFDAIEETPTVRKKELEQGDRNWRSSCRVRSREPIFRLRKWQNFPE